MESFKSEAEGLFRNKYNSEKWKSFLKDIFRDLPLDYFQNSEDLEGESLKKHKNINRISKFGDITLKDDTINFYEVELKDDYHVTRNRVGLRNILASEVDGAVVSGAIAVYYNPKAEDWRFSFISKKYSWDEKNQEIKKETTPKRYTYLFGKDEQVKTAVAQFYKLYEIRNENNTLDISDLLGAFSVEKISKDFFSGYKKHYGYFVEELGKSSFKNSVFGGNEKAIRDFVKKLLGRIVFLYFVQKKGWLGGDKDFVRNYFEKSEKEKFYNCYLQKLFFEALNKKRQNDDFKMPDGKEVKIPFLNGGLFDKESDKYDKINFSPSLFEGFFKFLAEYNFTIDESSPDDLQIGVDPEMLGHIFEELLEDRKEKGTFYTPRKIVQYMTQESLIEYLHTNLPKIEKEHITDFVKKKKLENIKNNLKAIDNFLNEVKICDPAIGSGAFPMGLLQEIFTLKSLIKYEQGYDVREPAKIKKAIIQNSIYGVDIEKGAVDIARLRFWLSLVVDEDKPRPLPNLDYKIVCGNSLMSRYKNLEESIDNCFKNYNKGKKKEERMNLEKFGKIINDYMDVSNPKKKQEYKNLIDDLKTKFKTELNQKDIEAKSKARGEYEILKKTLPGLTGERIHPKTRKKITQSQTKKAKEEFEKILLEHKEIIEGKKYKNAIEWRFEFPNLLDKEGNFEGFDIVIGNPPYVQLQKMIDESKKLKQQNYQTYEATGDLYCLFYERGNALLKDGGHLCFITSNKWMRAGYGKSLRRFFIKETTPKTLIDLGPGVFESATVDSNILLTQKCKDNPKNDECKAATLPDTNKLPNPDLDEISLPKGEASWIILSKIERQIKEKIERIGTPLKDWNTAINYGIKTGYNDAFIIDEDNKERLVAEDPKSAEIIRPNSCDEGIKIYRGILTGYNEAFIINAKTRKQILDNCKSAEEQTKTDKIIRPILRGRDIKRYEARWAGLYVILAIYNSHKYLEKDYPAIYQHLSHYKERLKQRGQCRYGGKGNKGQHHWLELDNNPSCAYMRDFYKQKIVYSEIVQEPQFFYDEGYYFPEATSFILTGENLKFLIALLNSKPSHYFFKTFYAGGGLSEKGIRYKKAFLENLPIPKLSKEEQKPFIELVDNILSKKSHNEDTTKEEQEIDKKVYKLYHLNEEEINFITAND